MECCGIECTSTLRAAGNLTLIPCLHKHNWLINLILIRQTPPLWLFKVCKTNAAEKKERKKASAQIDLVWLCTCSFCSVPWNEKKKNSQWWSAYFCILNLLMHREHGIPSQCTCTPICRGVVNRLTSQQAPVSIAGFTSASRSDGGQKVRAAAGSSSRRRRKTTT